MKIDPNGNKPAARRQIKEEGDQIVPWLEHQGMKKPGGNPGCFVSSERETWTLDLRIMNPAL